MAITDAGLGTTWTTGIGTFLTHLVTDDYTGRLNDARNNSAPILGLIPSTSRKVAGKFIVEQVLTGRNPNAFGYVGEGGKLPDPGTTSAATYAYRWRTCFARLLFDGSILRATNKEDVRFIDVIERDFQSCADDMAQDQARIMYNDGSGRLAQIQTGVNSTAQTLVLNQSWESVGTCTQPLSLYLSVGMRIAVISPDGATIRGVRTITAIGAETLGPPSTLAITLDSAVTSTTNDWIVKAQYTGGTPTRVDTGHRNEPMGLMGILSDDGCLDGNGASSVASNYTVVGADDYATTSATHFQGVAVTNTFNQAIIMTGGGVLRPLTEGLLQLAQSKLEKTNNAKIDMMISNYGPRDSYGISLLGQKQYHNTTELRGGWSVLDWNGKPWYVDRYCPDNRVLLLGLEGGGFIQHVNETFQPLNPYGPHWMRLPDDDKYQVPFVMSGNVGVGIRQRCGGQLTDLISASA
jgi:hypothetical protein